MAHLGWKKNHPIASGHMWTGDHDTEQVKSAVADATKGVWQYVSVKLLSLFSDQYYIHFYFQIRLVKKGIDCIEKYRDRNKKKGDNLCLLEAVLGNKHFEEVITNETLCLPQKVALWLKNDCWMIHVTWCDIKEIIACEHDYWYVASQDYHGYFDSLAQERHYAREVLDGHDAVVLEFIVMIA